MGYLSPDGTIKYSITGNVSVSFIAIVPYTVRVMFLAILILLIAMVGVLVIAMTRGLSLLGGLPKRGRLG